MKYSQAPKMGPLQGVKVAFNGISIAGPFVCELMAEWGADVIWLENPKAPDIARGGLQTSGDLERRNMRNFALNLKTEDGKEAFKRLIADCDIFLESTKGGSYAAQGMTDEWFWEINPKLVIVHLSGFGQTGLPEWVSRGSYDPIAQAFSGMMNLQGYPNSDYPPQPAHMSACDYIAALHACAGALAALNKAQETGIGDSVDVAQYEAALRCQAQHPGQYFNLDVIPFKEGYRHITATAWGLFECLNGGLMYIICLGVSQVKTLCEVLGFEYGKDMPYGTFYVNRFGNDYGAKFHEKWLEYCKTHDAAEIVDYLSARGVTCAKVNTYQDLMHDELFLEHEVLKRFTTMDGRSIVAPNVAPRFKCNPAYVWRPMPGIGQDNKDILEELGYKRAEIMKMYENGTVVEKPIRQMTVAEREMIQKIFGWDRPGGMMEIDNSKVL